MIVALLAFSLLLAITELGVELWRKQIDRERLREMGASVSVFVVAQLTERAGTALLGGAYLLVGAYIPWRIPINAGTVLLAIVVVDFLYYCEHRLEHRVRLLWSYHSIHHSSPIYNYTTALRVSFIDNFVSWIFFLPAVLMGFDPYVVLLAIVVGLAYQTWLHTELVGKLGPLEWLFMTPSQHRVHHGSDAIYLDKNYGGIFSVWDRLFGTHQVELHRPTYGLTEPIGTTHPIRVHTHELVAIAKDLVASRDLEEAWGHLFGPPGGRPRR